MTEQTDEPAATGDDAAAAETASETPEQTTARLEAELAETRDRALRAVAELENVRKRMRREMDEERRYAETSLLGDLLAVVDNLARAVAAAEQQTDVAALVAGVRLVAQQLDGVLNRHHCTQIAALGRPFDPNLHAAIGQQPSAEHPAGTCILVAQEGYLLHDRVLRPAQVFVSTAPAAT